MHIIVPTQYGCFASCIFALDSRSTIGYAFACLFVARVNQRAQLLSHSLDLQFARLCRLKSNTSKKIDS
jgi:hypothetical protein